MHFERKNLPQTGIMLQDVVVAQCIETPGRSVRTWVRCEGEVVQQLRDVVANVQACRKSVFDSGKCEVATFARQEAMVGQGVQHGARASS